MKVTQPARMAFSRSSRLGIVGWNQSRSPDRLEDALIADLSSRELGAQEARALADLWSGDFLPGRCSST